MSEYVPARISFEGEGFPIHDRVNGHIERIGEHAVQAWRIAKEGLRRIITALEQEQGQADTKSPQSQIPLDTLDITTGLIPQETQPDLSKSGILIDEIPQRVDVYSGSILTSPEEDSLGDGTYLARKTGGKDDSGNARTQARQKAEAARIAAAAEEKRKKEAEDARLVALKKVKRDADLQKQIDDAVKKKK